MAPYRFVHRLPKKAEMEAVSCIRFRFGHPIVSAVDGYGFEEDIRVDPTDLNLVYKDRHGCQPIDLEN